MKNITVDKAQLLAQVRENLDMHVREYSEAVVGWRQAVFDKLSELTQLHGAGESINLYLGSEFSKPQSYAKSYMRAIEMLKWDTSSTVTLDEKTFQQLVQDDWEWSSQFKYSSSQYMSSASADDDDNF